MAELEYTKGGLWERVRSCEGDEKEAWGEPCWVSEGRGLAQVLYAGCWVSAEQSQPNSRNALGLDLRQRQERVLFCKRPQELS